MPIRNAPHPPISLDFNVLFYVLSNQQHQHCKLCSPQMCTGELGCCMSVWRACICALGRLNRGKRKKGDQCTVPCRASSPCTRLQTQVEPTTSSNTSHRSQQNDSWLELALGQLNQCPLNHIGPHILEVHHTTDFRWPMNLLLTPMVRQNGGPANYFCIGLHSL